MGKMGEGFLTAKFAEVAEVEGEKHEEFFALVFIDYSIFSNHQFLADQ
jgi:hypothetical protein